MPQCVRIGMVGYARILHSIIQRRATKRDIVERGLCGHTAAVRVVSSFHSLGLVHVSYWRARADVAHQPVYSFGFKADVPPPDVRHSGRPVHAPPKAPKAQRVPPELLAFHSVFEALQAPCTLLEVTSETGIAWRSARKLIDELQRLGLTHIADWRRRDAGGMPEAMYVWGAGENKAYPPASRVERNRRYRENRRLRHLPMCFIPGAGVPA